MGILRGLDCWGCLGGGDDGRILIEGEWGDEGRGRGKENSSIQNVSLHRLLGYLSFVMATASNRLNLLYRSTA